MGRNASIYQHWYLISDKNAKNEVSIQLISFGISNQAVGCEHNDLIKFRELKYKLTIRLSFRLTNTELNDQVTTKQVTTLIVNSFMGGRILDYSGWWRLNYLTNCYHLIKKCPNWDFCIEVKIFRIMSTRAWASTDNILLQSHLFGENVNLM